MKIALLGSFRGHCAPEWLCTAGHDVVRLGPELDPAVELRALNADLALLDLDPTPCGLAALNRLRMAVGPFFPIVVVLIDDQEEHVVAALRNGADDCLAVPMRKDEFLARVALPTRWKLRPAQAEQLRVECFSINLAERQFLRHGVLVAMTEKDFDVAVLLLSNVGRMLSRSHIVSAIWGESATTTSRTVDTHISRLRTKLRLREEEGWRLEAIYSKGYRLLRIDARSDNLSVASIPTSALLPRRVVPPGQGQPARVNRRLAGDAGSRREAPIRTQLAYDPTPRS